MPSIATVTYCHHKNDAHQKIADNPEPYMSLKINHQLLGLVAHGLVVHTAVLFLHLAV